MASPQRVNSPQGSPPYPTHSALPGGLSRKRPAGPGGGMPPKRARPSISSVGTAPSLHPLRQTSFPPEENEDQNDRALRSPSVMSDATNATGFTNSRSVAGSAVRGRKSKGGRGKVKGDRRPGRPAKSVASSNTKVEDAPDDDEEEPPDEDVDVDDLGVVDDAGKADRDTEKKRMAVLFDAFNDEERDRYEAFRRVKLRSDRIRKIVNQTLSQSVPANVITTINGFAKVFVGTIIERARDIQEQELRASLPQPNPPDLLLTRTNNSFSPSLSRDFLFEDEDRLNVDTKTRLRAALLAKPEFEYGKYKPGPLQPDHIREAFRRYKRDGEGGGAGVDGFSVGLGLPGTAVAKLGGKRLFK